MSSEILVSRMHTDSRAVAQDLPGLDSAAQRELPQPSGGSATAGYRSATYTPAEWFSNYRAILRQADTDRQEAQRIQRGSKFLSQSSEAATQQTQADGTCLLGERLQETHGWSSELRRHVEQLRADTEALGALRRRLEKALDATEIPYAIASDNLNCRTKRPEPDLVRDTVEEELIKELDLIRSIQSLLQRTIDQVATQIKVNQETQRILEFDWSDKYESYNFDVDCGSYSNSSPNTQLHPSSAALQDQVCNRASWTKFTQDNITKALQEEQATNHLRALVERVLVDTTEDLRAQCCSVDQALNQRCTELSQAKIQLEMKLSEILEQIGAQEKNIVAVQQAIHNKEAPLRVAQSRLYLRSLRPNMELCRDEPQLSLEAEVRQIDATVASLQQQLSEARGSLSHLEESRRAIEKDILNVGPKVAVLELDSRAVAKDVPENEPPKDVLQLSTGTVLMGFRSGKYTPAEWFSNYQTILQQADSDQQEAETVERGAKFLYQSNDVVTLNTQSSGTGLLGERLQEIYHWRTELHRHIDQLRADTESLQVLKTRLEKALDATDIPHAIATDNLSCRMKRLEPDLVKDTVEEELLKEVDLIRGVQSLLKRTIAQVATQIKMNREVKQILELDWSDKHEAYSVDVSCGRYHNMSLDTQLHPITTTMQPQMCNRASWTKFTQDNITKALQEEQATNNLRALAERVLVDITEDLRAQCSNVDRALNQRCMELSQAKIRLEMKLSEILEQIGAQEKNIVAVQQAIYNKEAPLRVVHSRLYLRTLRPNMELCRDKPQISFEAEMQQIDGTMASLHQQLSEARASLSHLEDSRMAIEKDIMSKTNSLFIDKDNCMTHRKRYPTTFTLSGY